ncbi:MAG: ribosome biogenesis GTPase Der [Phycisphaerales bacterium]|nr:ribosome biogenesis GTPase Der [Phycisphaerales bacterium]
MPVPRIAIIGRPNVGKSSLLNLMAKRKVAIVDPTPGVTRDRVSVIVDIDSPDGKGPVKPAEVTDTGGYGIYTAEGERYDDVGADLSTLRKDIEQQIANAIATADVILFAVDAQAGITRDDEAIAQMLRTGRFGPGRGGVGERHGGTGARGQEGGSRLGEPGHQQQIRVIATKVDGPKWEAHAHEMAALGFGEPLMVSSKSNYFRRDFLDALWLSLPEPDPEPARPADLQVAVIGKRNAGKSSLVNALAGEPRVIVSEIAGTTRDAVDVLVEYEGRKVMLIDTAGLRKKKSFQGAIEWYAFDRAKHAIDRSDVIILMIDATTDLSQVDEQLAMLAQKAYKPVVIAINKWDLVEGQHNTKGKLVGPDDYEEYVRRELKGLDFAPMAIMSAETGLNLRGLLELAFEMFEQAATRVPTGQLNRLVRGLIETRAPSNRQGKRARVYYVAQVKTNPPTIALVVNDPDLFDHNYERFLHNRFREELPFSEVPIRLIIRGRKRGDDLHRTDQPDEAPSAESLGWTDAELAELPDEAEAYFDE